MTIWKPDLQSFGGARYAAIAQCIAQDIKRGLLKPGDRLPPQRELADTLGVTVGTVTRAYSEAQRRGLARGEVGRGTFVKETEGWDPLLTPGRETSIIDMGPSLPLYSEDPDLAVALRAMTRGHDLKRLTQYQPLTGTNADRQVGSRWLRQHGLEANPSDIVITSGAQHAIYILLSTLCQRGDTILCEAVTYPGVKNAAALLDLKLLGVPMDADGLLPSALDRLCREHQPRMLYCMSTLQNPTTATMSAGRRAEIAQIARCHNLQLIEDDVHCLLAEEALPPLAALAPERVFYIASTSKVLACGLRVAYVVAPASYVERLAFAIAASVWTTPPLMVALASQLIEDGTAAATLQRKKAEAAARQGIAARLLPAGSVRTAPRSYFLWLELPSSWSSETFVAAAREQGVAITPRSTFAVANDAGVAAVRVSLSAPQHREEVERGLAQLARLLQQAPTTRSLMV